MKRLNLDNGYYYVDDPETDIGTGEALDINIKKNTEELDNTTRIKIINEEELLENTLVDIWGDNNA